MSLTDIEGLFFFAIVTIALVSWTIRLTRWFGALQIKILECLLVDDGREKG